MTRVMDSQSAAFIKTAEQPVETVGEGIKRQMLGYGSDLMLCRVWFESGAVGDVHSHMHSQSSYVESGQFRVFIDGEEQELSAGDSFYTAPHKDHGAMCLEAGSLLDTFSPARQDFLSSGERS